MAGVYIDSEERGLPYFFFFTGNPRAASGRIPATELITAMDKLVFRTGKGEILLGKDGSNVYYSIVVVILLLCTVLYLVRD